MEASSPSCSITSARPFVLRAKEMTKHIRRKHRRTQNEQAHTARHGNTNFCVLRRSSVDELPLRMPRALAPRVPKPKITLTTAFTDHTDDERPDSISVQSVSSVVQISVVEIFAVQNIVASDAKPPRRTQVGRSSDAKRRERSSPQVVSPTRVRMQYQNRRTVRTQNPGTPGSG